MTDADRTRITYRYDRWRSIAIGVLETAQQTFLLWVAVRIFQAGPTAKAIIASGPSVGLLLSLLVVSLAAPSRVPAGRIASRLALLSALGFGAMSLFPSLPVFIAGSVLGMAGITVMVPLLTQMYQDNYPAEQRGRLFSRAIMIRVAVGAVFGLIAGKLLADHSDWYRLLLVSYAVAAVFVAFCLGRFPSQPLAAHGGRHPLRALRLFREDRVFRLTLICWMIMGFANLMMIPLRVDYLANPVYQIEFSATKIALLTAVIPNLVRLVVSPLWGFLFDRVNFFLLRALLNLAFIAAILAFFNSRGDLGLGLASAIFGFCRAGGEVSWNLWVTKVAPPQRVADYMSVHTFFTGLRGLTAPLVGFHLVAIVGIQHLAWLSSTVIAFSALILFREVSAGRGLDPGITLVKRGTE